MSSSTADRYLRAGLPIPVASRDGLDAPFWAALNEGRLVLQHCNGCGKFQWGPEWVCHRCHSFDLGYEETPAEGLIYSHQRVWHPVHPALADQGPYVIVLVELPGADGVRSGRYRKAGALDAGVPMLVFFAEVFGVSAGDTLELRLRGPDDATLVARRIPIVERQARRYAYVGVRRTAGAWPPGVYRGEARLLRADGGTSPAAGQAASIQIR